MTHVIAENASACSDCPGRLFSLWELMNKFNAKDVAKRLAEFSSVRSSAKALDGRPDKDQLGLNWTLFRSVQDSLKVIPKDFKESVTVLGRLLKRATRVKPNTISAGAMEEIADADWHVIVRDMERLQFLYVAEDRASYLDQKRLFGDAVYDNFPSARRDIREAGNCLSAECGTGAVFHLMRASEVALRALCADRGKTYPDASLQAKQVGDLLGALDSEINDLRKEDWRKWPSRDVKDAQIQFYHSALVEFRDFNEAWRKHMAHAHEGAFYDRDMARGILGHVRGLMQVLAGKISETSTTPKYWQSA